jgi:hypothetical protein
MADATLERTRDRTGFVFAPVRWVARLGRVALARGAVRPYRRRDTSRTCSARPETADAARSGAEGRPPSAAWVRPIAVADDEVREATAIARLSELTAAQTLSSRACLAGGSGDFPSTHQSAEGAEIRHVASRVLHTSTRRTPSAVDVSRTAQPRVATYTSNVSDFRPTTGLVYVGSPLAAGTSPWHSTTPTPGPRMAAGRPRLLVRHPAGFVRPVSALSRPASAGNAREATRARPPGETGSVVPPGRFSCVRRSWWR